MTVITGEKEFFKGIGQIKFEGLRRTCMSRNKHGRPCLRYSSANQYNQCRYKHRASKPLAGKGRKPVLHLFSRVHFQSRETDFKSWTNYGVQRLKLIYAPLLAS